MLVGLSCVFLICRKAASLHKFQIYSVGRESDFPCLVIIGALYGELASLFSAAKADAALAFNHEIQ